MGIIDGTTLDVISDDGKGKVICKCTVCNNSDIYDKKYLMESKQECRYCKKIKRLYDDTSLNETTQLNILLKEEYLRETGEIGKLKPGRKYVSTNKKYLQKIGDIGDTIIAIGVYGEWGAKGMLAPTHLVTKCTRCGAPKLREIPRKSGVTVRYICKTCEKINEYDKEQKMKLKILEEQKENAKKEPVDKQDKSVIKESDWLAKYEDTIRENNTNHYVRAEIIDNKKVVTLICKKCGFVVKKVKPNKNYTVPECDGCKRRLTDREYRGICKLNLKGRIYNGMEIINQYTDPVKGYLCDIKCAICGEKESIVKGVYTIDVINRKHFHDCEYLKIENTCNHCHNTIKLTIKEIMNADNIKCSKCGEPLDKTDLNFEINAFDMKISFNRARKNIDGGRPTSEMVPSSNNNLFYDAMPIYRSDSEDYYRCICINHGSRLTLSETEINNYNCEKCNDVNEELLRTLKPSNIRIKGNLRIKQKE